MRKYIAIIALLLAPLFLSAQYTSGLSGLGLNNYIEQTDFDSLHIVTGGLWINNAQVTATAAELNYLDITTLGTGAASKAVVLDAGDDYIWPSAGVLTYGGTAVTATGAELNYLDITTLGTGAASKAVVLDAGEDYTWPATGVLTYGVLNDGTNAITSSAAEINYLDITTLGTGAASKAIVLDAGDDYIWPATGVLTYWGTGITATGAELNYLDIATLGTGAASKAVVLDAGDDYIWPATGVLTYGVLNDGSNAITATAAQLNFLSGVTAGTSAASKAVVLDGSSKINAIDITTLSIGGVAVTATAANLNAIPTTTSTAAELNYLDIAALGTGAASKAVVLDAGEDYTWPATGVLTYGVLNDGSNAITSSALEINILDGVTATFTEINYLDITTLGTGAASKAVVLDAGEDYIWPATGILTYGVLNDGTDAITATAAEINRIADKTASIVNCTDGTLAVTLALHGDRVITLNRAAGITVTLPLATGTGASYTFIIGTTITSNSYIIKVGDNSDVFDGGLALGVDTDLEGATGYTWRADPGDDTVTMNGTATGGVVGDYVKVIDYATDFWYIEVHIQQSGGGEATPFTSTV